MIDATRCTKCGHAARYYDTRLGFCALVLPENAPDGDGITRWFCGCKCVYALQPPRDSPHDPSGEWEP